MNYLQDLAEHTQRPYCRLIKIKVIDRHLQHSARSEARESFMPTDTIAVLIMATAFGIFAATLHWADLRTRGLSR